MEKLTWNERFTEKLDIEYSYRLAKEMQKIRSNPMLGFRTAGSKAELETGELLYEEMKKIGLSNVRKDRILLDSWEFKKAELSFSYKGSRETIRLGAYQTQFVTDGREAFSLVYAGKGTEKEYEGLDVRGKLVLVDINQRDEWWISLPVYQAYLKGAKAVLAVQDGGYGEIDDEALNAQNIAGPKEAAAFSVSRADAAKLKEELKASENGEITVFMDADSQVRENRESYNIVGEIPGRQKDRRILLSAHYDSYFDGFQDDNTAVSMTYGIAKALLESGYQPEHTIVVLSLAAEEWGVTDSPYDWSTGAYEEVFTVHPEWAGSTILDLNFELPAKAHGRKGAVRGTYEYEYALRKFADAYFDEDTEEGQERKKEMLRIFPEGFRVLSPIETWSDDFSMSIAGIPSLVNEFSSSGFMETHYHSQFDSDMYYDREVYAFHHRFYGLLLQYFDRMTVAPLDFENGSLALIKCLEKEEGSKKESESLIHAVRETAKAGRAVYEKLCTVNRLFPALEEKDAEKAKGLRKEIQEAETVLLGIFRMVQDEFVSLDWHDTVLFPHETAARNVRFLKAARASLAEGKLAEAVQALYEIDNNQYAFLFEKEVYEHFTDYVLHQPKERLKWGFGRIRNHENLYTLVESLLLKSGEQKAGSFSEKDVSKEDFSDETAYITEAIKRQEKCFAAECEKMEKAEEKISGKLKNVEKTLDSLISEMS